MDRDFARAVVERAGALLVTRGDGTLVFREEWEQTFATFLGNALLEDGSRLDAIPAALGAVGTALGQTPGGAEAAAQLAAFVTDLLRRFEAHVRAASATADKERERGAALIGGIKPAAVPAKAPDDSLKAGPLARFLLSKPDTKR